MIVRAMFASCCAQTAELNLKNYLVKENSLWLSTNDYFPIVKTKMALEHTAKAR